MVEWRAYYGDGTTWDSSQGIEAMPVRDVQVILQRDNQLRRVVTCGLDYYVFDGGLWHACDIFGMFDYLTRPGWKRIAFGRMMPEAEYRAIRERADLDLEFNG